MLLLKALWLLLPAGFSNMSPIIAKKLFPKWNTPIDFGKSWRGSEIFGSHKTYRGLLSGTVIGMVIFYLQQRLFEFYPPVRSWSLFDYQQTSPLFGAWMGLCALLGDLIKSFFKRRLKIAPGKPWIILDEIDWIAGSLLGLSVVFVPGFTLVITCFVVGTGLHFIIRRVAYMLGLVAEPL